VRAQIDKMNRRLSSIELGLTLVLTFLVATSVAFILGAEVGYALTIGLTVTGGYTVGKILISLWGFVKEVYRDSVLDKTSDF